VSVVAMQKHQPATQMGKPLRGDNQLAFYMGVMVLASAAISSKVEIICK